jgi:hypothetical protein
MTHDEKCYSMANTAWTETVNSTRRELMANCWFPY